MADILYEELVGLNYNPTNDIDDELPPEYVVLYLKNNSGMDKKIIVEPIPLQQILLSNQNPSLRLIDNKAVFCLSPPSMQEISCEDTSGCIDIKGLWDLEIDGERILIDVTPEQMESYLINDTDELTNSPTCCFSRYYRSVHLPYPIQEGSTIYIPIALTPDGESITTPMVAQGADPYNNIGEQLAIQLEPHGLYARNNMFSNSHNTSFGITYYNSTAYNNTFFYILDEGNTFSEEQMPRGLPPYRCFFLV